MAQWKVQRQQKKNGTGTDTLDLAKAKSMDNLRDLCNTYKDFTLSSGMKQWPLKDQFENISGHTQKGIDFCERYSHFIKERCAIENEYASRLKKLAKNYKSKKSENGEETSCLRGFYRMLKEIHDLAGQHESIAECLNASIFKELQSLVTELKTDRRKCLHDGAKQQNLLRLQLEQNDKAKKQYEKAFKESEKAQENYKKADADIHLSRADVEKAKTQMHQKQANCDQCKNEYASELQKTNQFQSTHYTKSMPEIFSYLQTLEEKRVNTIQDFIKQTAEIERRTVPIISTCLDGMVNSAQSINAVEDSKIVVERYQSGFTPPGDIPFEDLSNASENQGGTPKATRGTKGDTFSSKQKKARAGLFGGIFGGAKQSFKDISPGGRRNGLWRGDDTKEDFSNLPPNQQKKKLNEKIESVRQDITKETAERDGMLKMRDVYTQNPNLGDAQILDKRLEPNAQKLDSLRRELQKYEGYLAEADKRNLTSRASNSLNKRGSDVNLSSSMHNSNPNIPVQQHGEHPNAVDHSLSNESCEDSFDDLDDGDDFELASVGKCTALFPFEAPNDGSIPMQEGEEFIVIEKDTGDGWTHVKSNSGEIGFVPTSYIQCTFH